MEWGRLSMGTLVVTSEVPDPSDDWTQEALLTRRWGVHGVITHYHDAHGLTYEVSHVDDGSVGHYEPREIRPDTDPSVMRPIVAALVQKMKDGDRARSILKILRDPVEHSFDCALGAVPACTCGMWDVKDTLAGAREG